MEDEVAVNNDKEELVPRASVEASGVEHQSIEEKSGIDSNSSVQEGGDQEEKKEADQAKFIQNFAILLKSPCDTAIFSPSLDINNDDNLHGLGLHLTTERSKSIARFNRRMAVSIADIATVYEHFGMVILRALPAPNSLEHEPSKDCYEAGRKFAMGARRLAEFYRTRLTSPIQESLTANRTSIDSSNQRYVLSRVESFEARRSALTARKKYVRAVRDAEATFLVWKKARKKVTQNSSDAGATTDDDLPWEVTLKRLGRSVPEVTDRLIQQLKNVGKCQKHYIDLVEKENQAVAHSQKVEISALQEFQKVELIRINLLLNSVVKGIFSTEKEMLENVRLSPHVIDIEAEDEPLAVALEKKGKDLLANLFQKATLSYEEGMGRMDADTLGLPEELGSLRDTVKLKISARASRIKATQTIADFLDEFAAGATNVAAALKIKARPQDHSRLSVSGKGTQEPLQDFVVGPKAGQLWASTMKIFEDEAVQIAVLGKSLRTLIRDKLASFLTTAEKDLKYESETDDNNWKQLCDVARVDSKAESRYLQSKMLHQKARARVHSADGRARSRASSSDGSWDDLNPRDDLNPQKRVSQTFGKIFAGGEALAKNLQESAKLVIAKNNLNEADQKAAKEQQAFEEATSAKSQAVAAYKQVTQARIHKFEADERQGWDDFKEIHEALMKGINAISNARRESLEKSLLDKNIITFEWLIRDVEEWVHSTKKTIGEAHEKALAEGSGTSKDPASKASQNGFKLSTVFAQSESVDKLLELQGTEESIPELLVKPEESLSTGTNSEQPSSNGDTREKQKEPQSEEFHGENNTNTIERDSSQKSLRKSITVPEEVHSWNKGQASVEHADSDPEDADDQQETTEEESPETMAFLKEFWSDKPEDEKPPEILRVWNCAYRPKEKGGFLISISHGRLYTTVENIYFLAWDGKNLILSWEDIADIRKEKGFMAANDTLLVTYQLEGNEVTFILSRLESIDSTLQHLLKLFMASKVQEISKSPDNLTVPPVPPDNVLKQMTVVLSKTIKNVSIQQVYEKVWSEGNGTSAAPFYGPWLEDEGCFDFLVKHWEFAEPESQGFVNEWCKERYPQRRQVTFKFNRTSHLYIGPPVAIVKQIQYCRVENNDKCVLVISAKFEGIPYADTFEVEMRWVGRREGTNDIKVEVGLHVVFKKNTMLKNKISAGTISETRNVHRRLFEAARKACCMPGETPEEPEEEEEETTKEEDLEVEVGLLAKLQDLVAQVPVDRRLLYAGAALALPVAWKLLSYIFGSRQTRDVEYLGHRIDELQEEVRTLQKSVDVIISLLKEK